MKMMHVSISGHAAAKTFRFATLLLVSIVLIAAQSCGKSSSDSGKSGRVGRSADGSPGAVSGGTASGADAASGTGAAAGTEAAAIEAAAAAEAAAAGETTTDAGTASAVGKAATDAQTPGTAAKPLTPEELAKLAAQAEIAKKAAEAKRIAALPVNAPLIKLAPGVYTSAQTVGISVDTKDAVIMYTLDGSSPDQKKGIKYSAPVTISATTEIKSIAYIPGGRTSAETSADYAIGEIFVGQGGSGEGNRRNPFADIQAAVGKAKTLGIKIIKISAGTFTGSIEITSPIVISGGWQPGFGGLSSAPSIIKGADAASSTKPAPAFALKLSGAAVTAETKFENLEIRGGEASYSAAILVNDGATPQFVNVRSAGGFGSYGYGAAVFSSANPVFKGCTLSGGEGATSYGLSVDSARAQVSSSYLLAGTGGVGGYGLSATDARVAISSSVLAGSAANVSYGAAFYNCKNSGLENCTVVGGSGKEGVGVFISASNPAIVNCIISAQGVTKSYGITDNYGDSAPSSLSGNAFIGCSGALYFEVDSKTAYTQCDPSGKLLSSAGVALAKPSNTGNAVASFALQAPLYKTPAGVTLPAGKVLTGNAATDILGTVRSDPWTVGAYEL